MDESVTSAEEPERWLPVVDYKGLYEVSSLGRIRGLDRMIGNAGRGTRLWPGRIMKPKMVIRYLGINLWRGGEKRSYYVHILVARAFLGPCPEGHQVCHGPGGNLDNRLVNLSYGTAAKNNGPDKHRDGTIQFGTRHPQAKLTDDLVRECRVRAAAGEPHHSLALAFGVSQAAIQHLVRGFTWKHVAGLPEVPPPPGHRGESHWDARLTEAAVRDIRARYAERSISMADLARIYGVSSSSIGRVVNRQSWKHVA